MAAQRSADTYDYLRQHIPALEDRMDTMEAKGFNQTNFTMENVQSFSNGFEMLKGTIQLENAALWWRVVISVPLAVILGFAIAMVMQLNPKGGE